MKLSTETLTILKNFSTLNQNIEFKKGNKLSTISSGKAVLAEATLKDNFPQDFCVYDLNQFLSVHAMFKDTAEIDFDNANIILNSGRNQVKYRLAAKEMILSPQKGITLPSVDCSFHMTADDYSSIATSSKILSSPHIAFTSDGDKVELVCFDAKNDSEHTNSIRIADGNGKTYRMVFLTENIKMLPGSYDVELSFAGIAHFKHVSGDVEYWVACEEKFTVID